MLKTIVIAGLGLMLAGCSMSHISEISNRLSVQEPGSLIVVCPGGKVILNTDNKKSCFGFMETGEDS